MKLLHLRPWFQHTAARRRLGSLRAAGEGRASWFQHTAARRRLQTAPRRNRRSVRFNTQPPEGGCNAIAEFNLTVAVSTHSRPKAAGAWIPEAKPPKKVSTHSRPKAAEIFCPTVSTEPKFQHTAARRRLLDVLGLRPATIVSTHSRPKAAGEVGAADSQGKAVSTHSRPKAAVYLRQQTFLQRDKFQHTAARRRLLGFSAEDLSLIVSTHSRPKAAGGWLGKTASATPFQHTAARRRLQAILDMVKGMGQFQHTAARRRLINDEISLIR